MLTPLTTHNAFSDSFARKLRKISCKSSVEVRFFTGNHVFSLKNKNYVYLQSCIFFYVKMHLNLGANFIILGFVLYLWRKIGKPSLLKHLATKTFQVFLKAYQFRKSTIFSHFFTGIAIVKENTWAIFQRKTINSNKLEASEILIFLNKILVFWWTISLCQEYVQNFSLQNQEMRNSELKVGLSEEFCQIKLLPILVRKITNVDLGGILKWK